MSPSVLGQRGAIGRNVLHTTIVNIIVGAPPAFGAVLPTGGPDHPSLSRGRLSPLHAAPLQDSEPSVGRGGALAAPEPLPSPSMKGGRQQAAVSGLDPGSPVGPCRPGYVGQGNGGKSHHPDSSQPGLSPHDPGVAGGAAPAARRSPASGKGRPLLYSASLTRSGQRAYAGLKGCDAGELDCAPGHSSFFPMSPAVESGSKAYWHYGVISWLATQWGCLKSCGGSPTCR